MYNYTSWLASVYYPSNGIPASCCLNFSDCNPEDLRNATIAPNKVFHQVSILLYPPTSSHCICQQMTVFKKNLKPQTCFLKKIFLLYTLTPQILSQIPILPLICTFNMSLDPLPTNLPPVFQGCYELVTSFMETNMAIIAGVTFGIAFSQVRLKNINVLNRCSNKR